MRALVVDDKLLRRVTRVAMTVLVVAAGWRSTSGTLHL